MTETIIYTLIVFIFVGLIVWIIEIIGAIWLAKEKGRDKVKWGILTAFFGLFAILFLALAPNKKNDKN